MSEDCEPPGFGIDSDALDQEAFSICVDVARQEYVECLGIVPSFQNCNDQ